MINFVLIHAPLVGPYTWAPVADVLRSMSHSVTLPVLTSPPGAKSPYWQMHARAVADAAAALPRERALVLVAHSGAGPLLPALRAGLDRPIAGYIFVDAGLPEDGKSRLDQFESPAAAEQFRAAAQNGLLPAWTDEDLREVIPEDAVRVRFVGELRPLPLRVYEEPLPVFPGWPDAPVGYLRFGSNPAYEGAAQRAIREGFAFRQMAGEHFHMLVRPEEVARALVAMVGEMNKEE